MPNYSVTALNTYKVCPRQYKFKYIERPEVEEKGIELFVGNRVGEALKRLYDELRFGRLLSLYDMLDYFETRWTTEWHDGVRIAKPGRTAEDYKKLATGCLSRYYQRYEPFDSAFVIGTERWVNLNLHDSTTGQPYRLRGRIDRLDRIQDGVYEIHDYKTSSHLPSQESLDADIQLGFYELTLREEFPHATEVTLVWHFLVHDEERRSRRTPAQLEALKDDLLSQIRTIEGDKNFPMNVRRTSPCDYCAYQQMCPAWEHEFRVLSLPPEQFTKDEGVALVNRYAELDAQEKEIERQKEETREALIQYTRSHGLQAVRGSDRIARLTFRPALRFPRSGTRERAQLERLLDERGILHEVCALNVNRLEDNILRESSWDAETESAIREFAEEDESVTVRLSKVTDRE